MLTHFELLALAIFSSYFTLIAVLFLIIFTNLPPGKLQWRPLVFLALAVASFAHTWFYMFKFLRWSFADFHSNSKSDDSLLPRLTSWLVGTGLFEQAWTAVSFGRMNWWWSEQLCLFTVGAWTTFLATEGRAHGIRFVAVYMLLGQLVAISVASNLFYLALSLSQTHPASSTKPRFATPSLWLCILASLITVALSPHTTQQTFLPNLLAMHTLIVIPLLSQQPTRDKPSRFSINVKSLYILIGATSLALRVRTTIFAVLSLPASSRSIPGFLASAIETLYAHPAQSSIGWDVIWTSASFVAWICLKPSSSSEPASVSKIVANAPIALVTMSLASAAVATPLALHGAEGQRQSESKSE